MSLPSGYKRLEYIRSSGTQYINTNLSMASGFRAEIDIEFTSLASSILSCVIGAHNDSSPYGRNFLAAQTSLFQIGMGDGYYNFGSPTTGEKYHIDFSNVYGNAYCKINGIGQTLSEAATGTNSYSVNTLYLLAVHGGESWFQKVSGNTYHCKIYSTEGTLVRDYIPCQTTAGEIGLWDDVNSVFYGNAGTGTFTAGPVIAIAAAASEVTELEYISSSNTQYISSAINPNQDTRLDLRVSSTQTGSHTIAGTDVSWTGNGFAIGVGFAHFGTETANISGMNDGNTHDISLNKNVLSVGGEVKHTFSSQTFSIGYSLALFANNRAESIQEITEMNLHACQIYDDGTLIRDYISAKLSDGTVGLYDKLHGLLYINMGTGTFTAGPEVGVLTPANFRLSTSTATTATLAWDAVDGATGYKLYRDGDLIATITDTSYTDAIQPFTPYAYTLTAYNDSGESDPATISVQIIIPPETPSNFRAFSASMTAISLAWDAVTGADSYQLKRDGAVIYTGPFPSYTDSGLTAETAYTYTLSAVNTAGSSAETTLEATTTQIILVTDRAQADVTAQNAKGTYSAIDLIRVGEAVQYLADILEGLGYACPVAPKLDWKETDWPTSSTMERYLQDVETLRGQFQQLETTPETPKNVDKLTYLSANDIEQILMDINGALQRMETALFYSGEIYCGEV